MAKFTRSTDISGRSIYDWEVANDRHYTLTSTTFTRRQLGDEERYTKVKGEIISVPWSRERLENERDALVFISHNTRIRVPKFLDFSYDNGLASITMEAVDGELMDQLAKTLKEEDQKRLKNNVFSYINGTVLPQLRRLRFKTLGSVYGKIIPPYRLQHRDHRPRWPSRTSAAQDFVCCHNDLAQHNIFVNPEILQVVAIIDWEFSGFYPEDFEYPFWLIPNAERVDWGHEDPAVDHLINFIDEPGKSMRTHR